jgi:hypothetical protein
MDESSGWILAAGRWGAAFRWTALNGVANCACNIVAAATPLVHYGM